MIMRASWEDTLKENRGLLMKVVRSAHRHLHRYLSQDELEAIATYAFYRACIDHDPSRGMGLTSFAFNKMRWAILTYVSQNDPARRRLRRRLHAFEQARSDLEQKRKHAVTEHEVGDSMGLSGTALMDLLVSKAHLYPARLEDMVQVRPGVRARIVEVVADPATADPAHAVERRDMRRLLNRALDRLDAKGRAVIILYYFEGLTWEKVGLRMGFSGQRAKQIEQRALPRLRDYLANVKIP